MLKKIISTVLLVSGLAFMALAQDKTADAVLTKMSNKYKALNSFKANFTYAVQNSAGKMGTAKKGEILVNGVKFKLNIAGQDIYNNGSEIYTYVKELNEVNVTEYDSSDDSDFSPSNIYKLYKKGFKYTYKGQKTVNGALCQMIELVPEKKGNVTKVVLAIAKANSEIKSWELTDTKGSKTIFNVLGFKANVPVNAKMFSFNEASYPGVEIVDLR